MIAMINLLIKDAQAGYETMMSEAVARRAADSKSISTATEKQVVMEIGGTAFKM